jgi:hypothetical protein
VRKAVNLTTICEPTVKTMWDPNLSQSYRFPRPVTDIALLSLYLDEVRTSQETDLWSSTACHRDSFISLYVYDIRTSEETHLEDSRSSYGNSFTLHTHMMFVRHRRHTYGPTRPATGINVLFILLTFVPHRKHTYRPPRPLTEIALLFYIRLFAHLTENIVVGLQHPLPR